MYRHYVPFGFQPNYINLAKITGLAKIKFDIEGSNVSEYSIDRKVITFTLDKRKTHMSHLLLLGKFEYGGGPIFKVVLEC